MQPEIAIVDANTLSGMGLKGILERLIPMAVIRIFSSFEQLVDDTPDAYVHYFVTAQIYFEHPAFFGERKHKTILLASSLSPQLNIQGLHVLDTSQPEETLVKQILHLNHSAHPQGYPVKAPDVRSMQQQAVDLSPREKEVLVLLVKGLINKEIADKLHISLTTVISHRKNISEKLGLKSISSLTIYAVMSGLVDADEI